MQPKTRSATIKLRAIITYSGCTINITLRTIQWQPSLQISVYHHHHHHHYYMHISQIYKNTHKNHKIMKIIRLPRLQSLLSQRWVQYKTELSTLAKTLVQIWWDNNLLIVWIHDLSVAELTMIKQWLSMLFYKTCKYHRLYCHLFEILFQS